jgi:ABC-2 type transport system ATP-binding protein
MPILAHREIPAPRPDGGGPAIEVADLGKVYPGGKVGLAGISFAVERGEIFGFLGPNGSGKTTTARILVTLLRQSAGVARVDGFDVEREPGRVRAVVGWAGQSVGIDDDLTGAENLALQGMLHGLAHDDAWAAAMQVLEELSLAGVAQQRAGRLSGGLRRRLDLATALVHRPAVLFLDEPTTGLDPQSRAGLWERLRHISREDGVTVFLTTQYLEEADRACDRVAIIDGGRLVTVGTPAALKDELGEDRLALAVADDAERAKAIRILRDCPWVARVEPGHPIVVHVADAAAGVAPLIRLLDEAGVKVVALEQRQPSLDDVFVRYTGSLPRAEAPVVGATSGIFATAHGRRRRP